MALSATDVRFLRRTVDLARAALENDDEPFGSVLVGGDSTELFADHNHVAAGDATQHPEFAIARWAAEHLTPEERAQATVYTSGEHCPMCSAAHAWVGLGRIVYAGSTEQLLTWRGDAGASAGPVAPLPIQQVAPGIEVDGPALDFADELRTLHQESVRRSGDR